MELGGQVKKSKFGSHIIAQERAGCCRFAAMDARMTVAEVEEEFIKRQFEAVRPERAADCTPGYYNNEGVGQDEDSNRLAGVPHVMNPLAWFATLEKRRKDGTALNYFNLSSVRHKL